jgi:hypothetical protein
MGELRKGDVLYCVDRAEGHGWRLHEAVVTRVFGDQAMVAQDGVSLQLDAAVIALYYAPDPDEAWNNEAGKLVRRLEDLRTACAADRARRAT